MHARQAYRLGIANGVLFSIGLGFVDPATVLPAFMNRLGQSELVVGLVTAIATGGWFLPQIIGASHVSSRPYKRPAYIQAALLRFFSGSALILVTYLLVPRKTELTLLLFLAFFALDAFSGGLSGPAFLDIVAKTVAPTRLGGFFAHRIFWGSLGAIGSGMVVRAILGPGWPAFPSDYALLFGLALAFYVPCWLAFLAIKEPPSEVTDPQPLLAFLRAAPALVTENREYRLLVMSRWLLGAVGIAFPFYTIFGQRALALPESVVGTYLALQMCGAMAATPLWALLNDRRGPRALVLGAAAATFVYSALAFSASLAPHSGWFGPAALGLVFFLLAAAGSAAFVGCTSYLFTIAPEARRPLYIGVQNTLFAITTFLPLLGGLVLRFGSFQLLFALATAFGAAGVATAIKLPAQPRRELG